MTDPAITPIHTIIDQICNKANSLLCEYFAKPENTGTRYRITKLTQDVLDTTLFSYPIDNRFCYMIIRMWVSGRSDIKQSAGNNGGLEFVQCGS